MADDTPPAETFAYATGDSYSDPAATSEEYTSLAAQAADEYYESDVGGQAFIAQEGAYNGGYDFVDAYGVPPLHAQIGSVE
jgi:hypothetical protein